MECFDSLEIELENRSHPHAQFLHSTERVEHEWVEVGNWCYSNFDSLSGISFLPFSDHSYRQAPYQDSTKEEYKKLCADMPDAIDWKEFDNYEKEDNTKASQELACSAGVCEVVDI